MFKSNLFTLSLFNLGSLYSYVWLSRIKCKIRPYFNSSEVCTSFGVLLVIKKGEHLSTFDKNSLNFDIYIYSLGLKKCVKLGFEVACSQKILTIVFCEGDINSIGTHLKLDSITSNIQSGFKRKKIVTYSWICKTVSIYQVSLNKQLMKVDSLCSKYLLSHLELDICSIYLICFSDVLKFCSIGWMQVACEVLFCLSSLVWMENKIKSR